MAASSTKTSVNTRSHTKFTLVIVVNITDEPEGYKEMSKSESSHNMKLIAAVVGIATIGGFLFGYDTGAINGAQKGLQTTFGLSDAGLGQLVSSLSLGCALGAFLAGRFADIWGRRVVMMVSAVLFIVSALASGSSTSWLLFGISRFAAGAAVGAASVLAPAYIAEVTPAKMRGGLTTVQQLMIILGITGAFVVNYFLAHWAGDSLSMFHGAPSWRWMFWVQAVPAVLFLMSLLLIPESPRFLVSKTRDDEARGVLALLFGEDAAETKLIEIKSSFAQDHRPSFADLIDKTSGKVSKLVWLGVVMAALQQFVGINVIFYYGAVLWQSVGFGEADALKINIVAGTVSFASCLIALMVVDRIGRKPLLLVGSIGMTLTLGVCTWCFSQGALNGALHLPHSLGVVAVIAANLYVIFFNGTWGPVLWVMLGDMFPNQMRGAALGLAGASLWLANYLVGSTFPWLAKTVGLASTYSFYTLCAFLSIFFVIRLINETKGIELEAIDGSGATAGARSDRISLTRQEAS
jgi:SP family sugar:H+ symporter-like MFS transporter